MSVVVALPVVMGIASDPNERSAIEQACRIDPHQGSSRKSSDIDFVQEAAQMPRAILVLALSACLLASPEAMAAPPIITPPATTVPPQENETAAGPLPLAIPIRAVMVGMIDYAAFGILLMAHTDRDLTKNEWLASAVAALNLAGAASLITMPGRGPHDAAWVADPEWRRSALELQESAMQVARATRAQDRLEFNAAANRLADACLTCHRRFNRPAAPQWGEPNKLADRGVDDAGR